MMSDLAEGLNASQLSEPQYDQFLISCSDDGSVNIYDVSSFNKDSNDEFYKKGQSNIYKVYSSAGSKLLESQDPLLAMKNLLDLKPQSQEAPIIEDDEDDNVTRRTRKRTPGPGAGAGNTN